MRYRVVAVFAALASGAGCGYVGPVLPPSPELPMAITNLAVIERGDQLIFTFTTPVRTTDSLIIKRFSEIDLRIGLDAHPFDIDSWAATAQQYELPIPPAADPDDPKPIAVAKVIPASSWMGKRVAILIRTSVKKTEHYSQWSNRIVLDVIPPLAPPVIEVKAVKDGYLLTWDGQPIGVQYVISRKGPNEKEPIQLGIAEASPYLDNTSVWETTYTYSAVAQQASAESLPSNAVTVTHANTFPPSVPSSITALAGPEAIEVSWSRSSDIDVKGYYLYRSTNSGAFERQGELTSLPTFSDRKVERGKTYRYAVSAVSQRDVESEKSPPAEVVFK